MSEDEMVKQLMENTKLVAEIHTALLGSPQYKQPGLVDRYEITESMVRRRDYIITRWGGGIAVVLFGIELMKSILGK